MRAVAVVERKDRRGVRFIALLMALLLAGTTAGIYAVGIGSGGVDLLGATGPASVELAAVEASVTGWAVDENGDVSQVEVSIVWDQDADGTYKLQVILLGAGDAVLDGGEADVIAEGGNVVSYPVNMDGGDAGAEAVSDVNILVYRAL